MGIQRKLKVEKRKRRREGDREWKAQNEGVKGRGIGLAEMDDWEPKQRRKGVESGGGPAADKVSFV
jgi:hypothetical protein